MNAGTAAWCNFRLVAKHLLQSMQFLVAALDSWTQRQHVSLPACQHEHEHALVNHQLNVDAIVHLLLPVQLHSTHVTDSRLHSQPNL